MVKRTPSTLLYFVFDASTVIEARFSQAAKASAPIVVTLAGIVTLVSPEQLNAFSLIVVTVAGTVISDNALQLKNVPSGIFLSADGRVTDERLKQ